MSNALKFAHMSKYLNFKLGRMQVIKPYFKKSFEEIGILKDIEKIFRKIRPAPFIMPKKGKSVILIVSGGLDSTSLWLTLIKKYKLKVYPIHFYNGMRSQKWSAQFFADYFQKRFPGYSFPLEIRTKIHDFYKYPFSKKNMNNLKEKFILNNVTFNKINNRPELLVPSNPTRFFYFNIAAFEYAHLLRLKKGVDINTVFIGIIEDDTLVVREATLTTLRAINLACCLIFADSDWQMSAPIEKEGNFYYSKKEFVTYAVKNGLPLEKTWSCEKNGLFHCGRCYHCAARSVFLKELNSNDKTFYLFNNKIVSIINKLLRLFF